MLIWCFGWNNSFINDRYIIYKKLYKHKIIYFLPSNCTTTFLDLALVPRISLDFTNGTTSELPWRVDRTCDAPLLSPHVALWTYLMLYGASFSNISAMSVWTNPGSNSIVLNPVVEPIANSVICPSMYRWYLRYVFYQLCWIQYTWYQCLCSFY